MYDMGSQKYGVSRVEEVCYEGVMRAQELRAQAVVVMSHGNELARWVSKYHIAQPIFVMTDNAKIVDQVDGYYRGCRGILVEDVKKEDVGALLKEKGFDIHGAVVVIDDWGKRVEVSEMEL